MTLDEYQKKSAQTLIVKGSEQELLNYVTLGLVGESAEIANKVKKIIRDDNNVITDKKRNEIAKEAGDVLWYLARVADITGHSLEEMASDNLDKLLSRQKRGTLKGSGDNR